jgi:5-methylcytosine-specific restriction endonuclease McrA
MFIQYHEVLGLIKQAHRFGDLGFLPCYRPNQGVIGQNRVLLTKCHVINQDLSVHNKLGILGHATMTAEDEKRLIVLAAIIRLGGSGTKEQVLDEIERAGLMKFLPHELLPCRTRDELYWRNDLAQIRRHLVSEGYVSNAQWNKWPVTENGKNHFASLASRLASQIKFQHLNPDVLSAVTALASGQQISDDNALSGETALVEGQQTQRWTNTYERNPQLRAAAIRVHGVVCMGCGFNFETKYGGIGAGFIEVHHTKPISSLGGAVSVDPTSDLVVLCSNCHSIVHRKRPSPLSLEALRASIEGPR